MGAQLVACRISLLKQSDPRAHGTGLQSDSSGVSAVRDAPHPLWAMCPSARSRHCGQVLPHVQVPLLGIGFCPFPLIPLPGTTEHSLSLLRTLTVYK